MRNSRRLDNLDRRAENLEMVLSQLSLKIFGTEVYLDRPIVSRLSETEHLAKLSSRRLDTIDDCLEEIINQNDKK